MHRIFMRCGQAGRRCRWSCWKFCIRRNGTQRRHWLLHVFLGWLIHRASAASPGKPYLELYTQKSLSIALSTLWVMRRSYRPGEIPAIWHLFDTRDGTYRSVGSRSIKCYCWQGICHAISGLAASSRQWYLVLLAPMRPCEGPEPNFVFVWFEPFSYSVIFASSLASCSRGYLIWFHGTVITRADLSNLVQSGRQGRGSQESNLLSFGGSVRRSTERSPP